MSHDVSGMQMTLGGLIAALEAMPEGSEVANLQNAHSYRGYYRDLSFELHDGHRPAVELLAECKEALRQTFYGYKGGEYVMDEKTLVWVADYGDSGSELIALHAGGKIVTESDD